MFHLDFPEEISTERSTWSDSNVKIENSLASDTELLTSFLSKKIASRLAKHASNVNYGILAHSVAWTDMGIAVRSTHGNCYAFHISYVGGIGMNLSSALRVISWE